MGFCKFYRGESEGKRIGWGWGEVRERWKKGKRMYEGNRVSAKIGLHITTKNPQAKKKSINPNLLRKYFMVGGGTGFVCR